MENSDVDQEESKRGRIRHLISTGAEISGAAIGGALGLIGGGPAAAILGGAGGAAVAAVLKHIGAEASERLLGPREQVRVGGVLAIAAGEIQQRLGHGEAIRTDGFFDPKGGARSEADEVAESVLLKSQRESEEKKIPYMGRLFASVAFDSQISAELAHQVIKTAEQLTYRQLCILKLAVVKESFGLRKGDYRGQGDFTKELYQILYECMDLSHRGLINFGTSVTFGPTDVNPGMMMPQAIGADIFNLMKLHEIPNAHLQPIAAQLK